MIIYEFTFCEMAGKNGILNRNNYSNRRPPISVIVETNLKAVFSAIRFSMKLINETVTTRSVKDWLDREHWIMVKTVLQGTRQLAREKQRLPKLGRDF